MPNWTFLTNHAQVLLCVADDPEVRLRDIAASVGITERSAYGIISDLADAGYVIKHKDGRRNRYQIQGHLPLPDAASRQRTVGELLVLLVDSDTGLQVDSDTGLQVGSPIGLQETARSHG